jgi:hypothetical protein
MHFFHEASFVMMGAAAPDESTDGGRRRFVDRAEGRAAGIAGNRKPLARQRASQGLSAPMHIKRHARGGLGSGVFEVDENKGR